MINLTICKSYKCNSVETIAVRQFDTLISLHECVDYWLDSYGIEESKPIINQVINGKDISGSVFALLNQEEALIFCYGTVDD